MHEVNEIALRVMKASHPKLMVGCSMDHVRLTQELHTFGGKMPECEVHIVDPVIQQRVRREFVGLILTQVKPDTGTVKKCHVLFRDFKQQRQAKSVAVERDGTANVPETNMDLSDCVQGE